MSALFVFGSLRHRGLREIVFGGKVAAAPARLAGWQVREVAGGHWPLLVEGPGAAEGLLITGLDATRQARADFFELGFGYVLRDVTVETSAGPASARAYFHPDPPEAGPEWDYEAWVRDWGEIWAAAAVETMQAFGRTAARDMARRWPMIELRAASRLRAAHGHPASLREAYTVAEDVELLAARRPYTSFFALEECDLRFRRFDGSFSAPVTRAGFVGGDAATVLPWDPERDLVLLVEQFRVGPMLRGDPLPWSLEPIAGRIDPGEAPEDCARREAAEEAAITLGALHHVADYYPSPGAVSEYVYAYVGEADLADRGGEVGGLASEHEDIRAHVIGFERLMRLIGTGEVANGPLILSALWLERHRAGR